jgi:uncharacterized protein (UPF0332 family)
MNAEDLMAKAAQAIVSAKILLDAGDNDGAGNRAYYSMFDAARAALLAAQAPVEPEAIRSHGGLITAFSLHLVKAGSVSIEMGKSINRVQELRSVADYKDESITSNDAAWAVTQAQIFVQTIRDTVIAAAEAGVRKKM